MRSVDRTCRRVALAIALAAPVLCAQASAPPARGQAPAARPGPAVFVRFKMLQPQAAAGYVRLGGYIHTEPWYLPTAVVPEGADRDPARRIPSGRFTEWFDLGRHAGKLLHGPLNRAGGVAELPNITAEFIADAKSEQSEQSAKTDQGAKGERSDSRTVVIELAAAPDDRQVIRRFEETFAGTLTSFLISPDLARDADKLETAAQMTARRLGWARQATAGQRISPKHLILQTSFWSPQRPDLNLQEAEVLWLLGLNVVGNQQPEVREKFGFRVPGHAHDVLFGPAATQGQIDALMKKHASRDKQAYAEGVPFGFADEVVCRPPIGADANALGHFRQWLAAEGVAPAAMGVARLADAVPIETPEDYRKRRGDGAAAAARAFYYTSRFRQAAATERVRWHTEAFHRHFAGGAATSTLVADHPYFGGTGLGMGMTPNTTWGGAPLAMDWFDLARRKAVDMAGVEDWMGLQFMYGPDSTWEGFQLMGFQAAIFRSGGRGEMPIIAWITPSDEMNLRLKTASALCQGAKHFFYWTYGPTATSTENYWSDLRGAHDGIAKMARQLAAAEHIIAPGKCRRTRLAMLYSISCDLWQPFGYVHMLERRATYLSLVHEQYLVDMLTEQDIEAGRLADYDVLYATDPCITDKASAAIRQWVRGGGSLYGSCAAGSRNEFDEPAGGLSEAFGIAREVATTTQPGRYAFRGGLNAMQYADRIRVGRIDAGGEPAEFGALGVKVAATAASAKVVGTFADGSPAVMANTFGKGTAIYVAACPALSYIKDARFVPAELKEKWPPVQRVFINALARRRGVPRLVELSAPVVEAGVYQTPEATALVLANFTYEPIDALRIRLPLAGPVRSIRSVERGPLEFTVEKGDPASPYPAAAVFTMPLGISDIVLAEDEHHPGKTAGAQTRPHEISAEAYERLADEKLKHTYPATAARMLSECGGIRKGTCIDLGCGAGHLDVEIARRSDLRIIGLDIDPNMKPLFEKRIREAGLERRVSFVLGDAQKLPFPDDSADIIVSRGMLAFLPDAKKCLREVDRVLKPTGVAFLGGRYLYAPQESKLPAEALRKIVAESGVPGAEVIDGRGQWVKIIGPSAPQAARESRGGPQMLAYRFIADYAISEGDCLLICQRDGPLEQRLQQGFAEATGLRITALYPTKELAAAAEARIRQAKLDDRIKCRVGDVHALPFAQGTFDAVANVAGLPFWRDRQKALGEVYRVLRPGGAALVGGEFRSLPPGRAVSTQALRDDAARTGIPSIRVLDDAGQWLEIRKPPRLGEPAQRQDGDG